MPLKSAAICLLLAATASAQAPAGDRFYEAIRQNDLAALRALVRDEGVDAKDPQGQTPLMLAAAYGSPESVRFLIASGADSRAASSAGVTSLHWAAGDLAKTRMLIDANADVNARSQLGRTPLIVAASAHGAADVVRLLLARGADANAADAAGVTPLIAAANVDNLDAARLLLEHGADPHAIARTGQPATPLMGAAVNGNIELVRALLAAKPDLAVTSADRTGTTKNGPVRFGNLTALHAAVTGARPEVVDLLLKAGAAVDAVDARGMTPLMWAVGTDRPQPRIVRLLLAYGARPALASAPGESAIDWALKFDNPAVLAELKLPAAARPAGPVIHASQPQGSARQTVARSLSLLVTGSARTMTDGGCPACHAQPLAAMAIDAARAREWTALSSDLQAAQSSLFMEVFAPQLLQLRDAGGQPDGGLYTAMMMAARRMPSTRATDAFVHFLAAKQRAGGNWPGVGATRAPMQDGDFSRTAMGIRALAVYATPARAGEYKERVVRASAWLSAQAPLTTEDRVMQLLGLYWADRDVPVRQKRIRELLALQQPDGGWAQTPHLASDAYATGQVLYALRALGQPAGNAALQRAAAFLLGTQRDDGSWYVKSRAMKIQPYFESGFPYGHDQWISQAGTAWAVMGLAATALDEPVATSVSRSTW